MALRNQPYLPLYVQDFMTDEKLVECSAETVGVYIRLMCIMHKSEEYGTVLLKQKDQQTESRCLDFAVKLSKQMPYTASVIEKGLAELIENKVVFIDGDKLLQKRMIRDNDISIKRSCSGKKGVDAKVFASAKPSANTEDENENKDIIVIKKKEEQEEKPKGKRKPSKKIGHPFSESPYSDLDKLVEKTGWPETKAKYYLDQMTFGSEAKGYLYLDWSLAAIQWAKRDGDAGKGFSVPGQTKTPACTL